MDVVTSYLNGPLDNNIYMKLPEIFRLPQTVHLSSREYYLIILNISFYDLKQFRRIWYDRLIEYLLA